MMDVVDQKTAGTAEPPCTDSSDAQAIQPEGSRTRRRTGGRYSCGFKGIAAAVAVACLFTLPSVIRAAKQQSFDITKPPAEEKAPDFVLTDLKGQRFRLSDYRGKRPVLIIFSTTWCTFCKAEIPRFKFLHETYAQQGLEVVNIDIQEPKDKAARFASQNQLPYRVLLDEDGAVSSVYEIRGVPTMVLVDKNGMIACRQCRTVESVLSSMMKK
jgi:peroxiredoxin